MIKKIVITYYDGAFGPDYIHWEEKMTITPEKVKFVRKHYKKCIETFDLDNEYKQIDEGWSYKINLWNENEYEYYKPIFDTILNRVKGFDTNLDEPWGCDTGDVGITVYDEDGLKYVFNNLRALLPEDTKDLFECFGKLIPENVLWPFFADDLDLEEKRSLAK